MNDTKQDAVTVLRAALEAAYEAMNHMGDVLNEHDMVRDEDEKHFAAFDRARMALQATATAPDEAQPTPRISAEAVIAELKRRIGGCALVDDKDLDDVLASMHQQPAPAAICTHAGVMSQEDCVHCAKGQPRSQDHKGGPWVHYNHPADRTPCSAPAADAEPSLEARRARAFEWLEQTHPYDGLFGLSAEARDLHHRSDYWDCGNNVLGGWFKGSTALEAVEAAMRAESEDGRG